jgi:DNA-binding Xre family transcriptional regulator
MTVNLKLDRKKIEKGISYGELARQCHITPATMSQIVNGNQHPHPRTVANLCAVLDCQPQEIGFCDKGVTK